MAVKKKVSKKASKPVKKSGRKPAAKGSSKRAKDVMGISGKIQIGPHAWPLERDVLFRPDRMKYVRKLIKPEGCVFCLAEKNGLSFETLCVYKTEHTMIILNKFPYNSGHLLILPRKHCGDLLKLSDIQFSDLNNTLRLAMKAIEDLYHPGGMNMGLNHGATAGAGIPEHLHYHLIPRWSGDLNFFPLIAETKVLVETLEQTYGRFMEYFKNI